MWKSLLTFNRAERRGSCLLYALMIGMLFLNTYYPFVFEKKPDPASLHPQIDSFRMHLIDREMPSEKTVRTKPGYVAKSAYRTPERIKEKPPPFKPQEKWELNRLDSAALVEVPGIGKVLSARILRYRQLLGGFADPGQLGEVYGIRKEWLEEMQACFYADTSLILPLAIDTASFKSILSHPYFDYEMTRRLFELRRKSKLISHIPAMELLERIGCPDSLRQRLLPYIPIARAARTQD
jgi:hypothetical protein